MLVDPAGRPVHSKPPFEFNTIKGPDRCMVLDCSDPEKETERFSLCIILRGFFKGVGHPQQVHVGLQVCKDCQPEAERLSEQFFHGETAERLKALYYAKECTPANLEESRIGWFGLGRYFKASNAVVDVVPQSQGLCETTSTERFAMVECTCPTYPENLGPCKTFIAGSNERCVYCDHQEKCHVALLAKLSEVVV